MIRKKSFKLTALALLISNALIANSAVASTAGCNMVAEAANEALNLHMQLAAAVPDVEQLFDLSGNCFSTLSQITDLSTAIPSISSIINAASTTVQSYLNQQVCTAVNDMSSMVTTPINEKINLINGNISSLSSLTGELHSTGGLSFISPDFIGQGNGANPGTITIGVNNGGQDQALTGGDWGGGNAAGDIGAITDSLNNTMNQINTIAAESVQVRMDAIMKQRDVDSKRAMLNSCNDAGSCGQLQDLYDQAQHELDELNKRYEELMAELDELSKGDDSNPTPAPTMNARGLQSLQFETVTSTDDELNRAISVTRPLNSLQDQSGSDESDESDNIGSLLY